MDNSNNKKATIKDVAQFAGVSTATVERALRNSDRIKKETRQRVLEAINVLNYQTNDVARALQSHRNYNILAVYHRTPEYFTVEFERGFHAAQQQLALLAQIRPGEVRLMKATSSFTSSSVGVSPSSVILLSDQIATPSQAIIRR